LKIDRSSIGAVASLSIRTKAGRRTAAAISDQMTTGSVQPDKPPFEMP
jgi:hypothetical protein